MSKNISPISIIKRLHELDLYFVTARMLADLFELPSARVYQLARQLKEKGLLAEVENGKYLVLGFEPARVLANPLFFATQLVTPSYISFWSALHYYGFTEQAPLTVFVATTKKKRPLVFHGQRVRFVTVRPRKFFGYRREIVSGLPTLMADEAKAIVDSLAESRYAGGIAEVAKALQRAIEDVDTATLVDYANRMGDKSLGSRLGFLLAKLGRPPEGDSLIHSTSPVMLDPSHPAARQMDSRWRLDVNRTDAELFPLGVG